jgi:hypothetical protein
MNSCLVDADCAPPARCVCDAAGCTICAVGL